MPPARVERALPCDNLILSQARLPIPPRGLGPIIAGSGEIGQLWAERLCRAAMAKPTIRLARTGVAFAISAIAAATLAGAWFFELALGLAPCPLCLDQRWPYYIAVPLALAVGLIAGKARRVQATRAGFLALAVVLAISAGLGVYHAGIEWALWPSPGTCAGVAPAAPGNILDALKNPPRFVSCDEAAWRWLGISLAGYNALIAGVLAWIAARTAYGSSSVSQ